MSADRQTIHQVHGIRNAVLPLTALHPHPDNYNLHPESQLRDLKASHHTLGQFQSCVVWAQPDGQSYIIVSGHGFIEGAKRDGAISIRADVLPPETSPATIQAILVAANLHQRQAVADEDILTRILREQQQAGMALSALGADDEMLRQLTQKMANTHATDFLQPFLTPSPPSPFPLDAAADVDQTPDEAFAAVSPAGGHAPVVQAFPSPESQLFFSFTVSVTPAQRGIILSAIRKAQQRWGLETSQNALTAICQTFLEGAGA